MGTACGCRGEELEEHSKHEAAQSSEYGAGGREHYQDSVGLLGIHWGLAGADDACEAPGTMVMVSPRLWRWRGLIVNKMRRRPEPLRTP